MNLIAFTGSMGTGKSTAVQYLKDLNIEKRVDLVKFAAPLYDIQEVVYNRIKAAHTRPETFTKDRKLLQWLGTEWGRSIDANLWVNLWKAEVKSISDKYPDAVIVCDDCRFDNEAKAVREMGGKIIKIISTKSGERIDTKAGIKQHSSESGISEQYVNYWVDNSYTLETYKSQLENIFELAL
jgi:hypothetical protein